MNTTDISGTTNNVKSTNKILDIVSNGNVCTMIIFFGPP